MNLQEYIDNRVKEIRYFLRCINFKNKKDKIKNKNEKIINGLVEEVDEIFNQNQLYVGETRKFINTVRMLYNKLIHDLEFTTSKEEVDKYILEFEKRLKLIVHEFKNNILKIFSKETGYMPNILNNNLDFIKIQIIKTDKEKHNEKESQEIIELNELRDVFNCIYILINHIKDKTIKSENILDLINLKYKVGTPEYKLFFRKYLEIKNESDYYKFLELYSNILKDMNITQDDIDTISPEEKKTKSK